MGIGIPFTHDVIGLPPAPWPVGYPSPFTENLAAVPLGTYPSPPWGEPGTRYLWILKQLVSRCLQLRTDGVIRSQGELEDLIRGALEVLDPAEAGEAVSIAAGDESSPALLLPGITEVPQVSYQYLTAQVHGKLGPYEEVSHTLALVHTGDSAAPAELAQTDLLAVAQGVGQAWTAFLNDPSGVSAYFSTSLTYDKVVVAAKSVSGPAPKTGSRKGLVKNDGQSAEWDFPAGVSGTGQQPLPFQCALVLSLGTGLKGGRYRGRVYLGGLSTTCAPSPDGTLSTNLGKIIGASFGTNVVAGLSRGLWHLNVWSPTLAAGREVSSVKVGAVIDTMRSRRKSLPETPVLAWGTA